MLYRNGLNSFCWYRNGAYGSDNHQKQEGGFGSLIVSMVVLTLFSVTIPEAIQYVSEDDTNMMMKAAKQLPEAKLYSKSDFHDSKRGENINGHSLSHSENGSKYVYIKEMR